MSHSYRNTFIVVNSRIQATWVSDHLRKLQPFVAVYEEAAHSRRYILRGLHNQQYPDQGTLPHDRHLLPGLLGIVTLDGSG